MHRAVSVKAWKKEVEKKQAKTSNIEIKIAFVLMYSFIACLFFTSPKTDFVGVSGAVNLKFMGFFLVMTLTPVLLGIWCSKALKK